MKLKLASTMWVVSRTPGENRILEILAEGTGPDVNSTTPLPLLMTDVGVDQL
jgi:hypothetical protein